MKKIVALVLSLVMALSLCTVAFAELKNNDVLVSEGGVAVTYKVAKANKDGSGYLAHFEAGGNYYVACEKGDEGAFALYDEDSEQRPGDTPVAYAKEAAEAEVFYDLTGKAVKETKWSCTSDKHAEGYVADGDYYVDAEDEDDFYAVMNVDGKLVKVDVDESFIKGSHLLYQYKSKPVSTGVYVYKCAFCGKEFNAAMSLAYAGTNYVEYKADESMLNLLFTDRVGGDQWIGYDQLGAYYVKVWDDLGLDEEDVDLGTLYLVGEAKADTNKDGVTSAKTFDAGIAMYVGMSLLSVAGGAVVIGKKKEF